jgi:hypothetical protein
MNPAIPRPHPSRKPSGRLSTILFALLILTPCALAFGSKFKVLLLLAKGDAEGLFALSPIANYLLASLGFLCLFVFGIGQGMFRDIESPKRDMLEQERLLDEQD